MDQTIKKIKKMTLFMKKEGILSLKDGETEIHLSPAFLKHEEEKEELVVSTAETKVPEPPLSYEDILLWSSPGGELGA